MNTQIVEDLRRLRLFFIRMYIYRFAGITICFRDAGIKYDEKNATLIDLTTWKDFSVGDWCKVDRLSGFEGCEPVDGVDWSETRFRDRIILAFFEIDGTFKNKSSGCKIRRTFCATGIGTSLDDKSCPYIMHAGGRNIMIDETCDNKKRVKLIAVDLLEKINTR